jgi:hypothetical protein
MLWQYSAAPSGILRRSFLKRKEIYQVYEQFHIGDMPHLPVGTVIPTHKTDGQITVPVNPSDKPCKATKVKLGQEIGVVPSPVARAEYRSPTESF